MKTFINCLFVSLFTFLTGLLITSGFIFMTQSSPVKSISANPVTTSADYSSISDQKNRYIAPQNIGIFRVYVNSNQSESNVVSEKNSRANNWTYHNGKFVVATKCCPNGKAF